MNCVFIDNMAKCLAIYWTQNNLFIAVFAFTWISLVWDTYLSLRQYSLYRTAKQVPRELRPDFDVKTFNKCIEYNSLRLRFRIQANVYHQSLISLVLWFQVIPLLWTVSGRLATKLNFAANNQYIQTALFVTVGSLVSIVADLPVSLYRTFVIEKSYGFTKQSISFYAKDRLMKFVVTQVILNAIISVAIYLIQTYDKYFSLYLWLFSFAVTLVLVIIYPDVIAPMFDTFKPLPDGQLKTSIEQLARSIHFPLKQIFVLEGSRRSAHSNAYFFGFYKNKQIVLYDTLFQDFHKNANKTKDKNTRPDTDGHQRIGCTDEEIVSIMAHELGHWHLNHAAKWVAISQILLLVYIGIYSMLYQNEILFRAFGFNDKRPVFVGLYLIVRFVLWPLNELVWFTVMCLSRHFEYGADHFEKQLKKGPHMRSALIRLFMDNLGSPLDDTLYSAWNHSHPTLLRRLKAFKTD